MTPAPTEGSAYRFLSDVIIARGLVAPSAMKAALQASLAGRSLTEILVDNGDLSEDDLARTLAEHHRLDYVDLEVFQVDRQAAALIEPDVARRFGAVPIAFLPGGEVVIALYDPNGSTAVLEFAQLTQRIIQPAVASRSQVETLIATVRRERLTSRPMAPVAPPVAAPAPVQLHSVPAGDLVAAPSQHPADVARPEAIAQPVGPPVAVPVPQPVAVDAHSHVDVVRQRAELAERRLFEAEERLRAAEERARQAEERATAAEARADSADARATAAEERCGAAEARAEGLSTAATAANDTLAQLVQASEDLEREAGSREPEIAALRAELDAERTQRTQLETQLRQPSPPDELLALQMRIAELERHLADAPPVEAPPPAPVVPEPPAPVYAVESFSPPSASSVVDIVGDPQTYVSALAPMPSSNASQPRSARNEAKARGLRRLIKAIKRGA